MKIWHIKKGSKLPHSDSQPHLSNSEMDNDPRPRKGKDGKKKDQKQKGKSQQLGSGKGVRAKLANLERAAQAQQEKTKIN